MKKKRVYGYVRVSTLSQADHGISLENQKSKIQSWAELYDHELVQIFSDEGITGRSISKRKGLQDLLSVIKENEILVVYSFSRLSRSVKDFLTITSELNERNCQIVILKEGLDTSTAHGKFSATLMSALAQLESDITSERVTDSMKYKSEKGEFVGRPPYGWKLESGKGSDLIQIPEEQALIRRIKSMRDTKIDDKVVSYQKIADQLNREEIPCPGKSKMWYHTTIKRIYSRETKNVVTKGRSKPDIIKELDRKRTEDPEIKTITSPDPTINTESPSLLLGNKILPAGAESVKEMAERARNFAFTKMKESTYDQSIIWTNIMSTKSDEEVLALIQEIVPQWK